MSGRFPKLVLLPILVFLLSLGVLLSNFIRTSDFILRDIDLKGGTLINIETPAPFDTSKIEQALVAKYGSAFVSNVQSARGYGIEIQVDKDVGVNGVISDLKNLGVAVNSFSSESISSFLGNLFFEQVVFILSIGFALMSIVIFIIYRNLITSFGIVFASLANILTALAITSLLGIKISFAGFAALLMLIAYTVDTNIVLTNQVLKTTPENFGRQYRRALSTGLTLISTITLTMLVVLLLSPSKLLVNVSQILVIGFIFDLPYTWILNSSLLEWWVRRRHHT